MKAVVSTTYDSKYFFFLPIINWCWNKLGVDVICFAPTIPDSKIADRINVVENAIISSGYGLALYNFISPIHKEATYAQCARLYAACIGLPEDECVVVSDVDMAVFGSEFSYLDDGRIHSVGYDLLDIDSIKQIAMCYLAMQVKDWRRVMDIGDKSYQQCLDELVGAIECEDFRGNQWSLDQVTAYKQFKKHGINPVAHNRAKMPERFATRRYDRDDSYMLERLSHDTLDFHMNRPGYEEGNFIKIMTVLRFHYPNEDFTWLENYRNEYIRLL